MTAKTLDGTLLRLHRAPNPAPPTHVTDHDAPADPAPQSGNQDSWAQLLEQLRNRYPGQKDSVLFCIHKLQQNPDLTMRDFRDEAMLYGIPMAGRALHSAKVLLGLATAKPRAPRVATTKDDEVGLHTDGPIERHKRKHAEDTPEGAIESQLVAAVKQLQSSANSETRQLRNAIKRAIAILQQAIEE